MRSRSGLVSRGLTLRVRGMQSRGIGRHGEGEGGRFKKGWRADVVLDIKLGEQRLCSNGRCRGLRLARRAGVQRRVVRLVPVGSLSWAVLDCDARPGGCAPPDTPLLSIWRAVRDCAMHRRPMNDMIRAGRWALHSGPSVVDSDQAPFLSGRDELQRMCVWRCRTTDTCWATWDDSKQLIAESSFFR